jgi:hypothetical protein
VTATIIDGIAVSAKIREECHYARARRCGAHDRIDAARQYNFVVRAMESGNFRHRVVTFVATASGSE